MTIKCNKCGKEITYGTSFDGIPNGVGFVLEDGTTYNICSDCLMDIGREKMEQEEKNANQP